MCLRGKQMRFENFENYEQAVKLLGEEKIAFLKETEKYCHELYGDAVYGGECIYSLVCKAGRNTGMTVLFSATPYKTEKGDIRYDLGLEEGRYMVCYRSLLERGGVLKLADKLCGLRGATAAKKVLKKDDMIVKKLYETIKDEAEC